MATSKEIDSVEVCDAVSATGILLNQICTAGAHYVRSHFDDGDYDNENFIILNLLVNLASDAKKRIKCAERELFKDLEEADGE